MEPIPPVNHKRSAGGKPAAGSAQPTPEPKTGANTDAIDSSGKTALVLAIDGTRTEVVDLLLPPAAAAAPVGDAAEAAGAGAAGAPSKMRIIGLVMLAAFALAPMCARRLAWRK
jgi:hypothetical protein